MNLNEAPFPVEGRSALLLAEGDFSLYGAKTAVCYLRYRSDDVAAVVDSTQSGLRAADILGFGGDIPVVGSVADGLKYHPEIAIIGMAPRGGQLHEALRVHVMGCIEAGLDIVSGLHVFLGEVEEFSKTAKISGSRFWDVRRVPETKKVATGAGCTTGAATVLVAGTDCNVGKMTATVELHREAVVRGINAAWAATGQTGIILRGRGVAVDHVVGDFIAGAAEELVNSEGDGRDVVFVEGQGSLIHPGYAAVTLGLLFGVVPDCIVLAHAAQRERVGESPVVMPPLKEMIELHESTMKPLKNTRVVAVALNTAHVDETRAREIMSKECKNTGLVVTDPVRFGASEIIDAVMEGLKPPKASRGK